MYMETPTHADGELVAMHDNDGSEAIAKIPSPLPPCPLGHVSLSCLFIPKAGCEAQLSFGRFTVLGHCLAPTNNQQLTLAGHRSPGGLGG